MLKQSQAILRKGIYFLSISKESKGGVDLAEEISNGVIVQDFSTPQALRSQEERRPEWLRNILHGYLELRDKLACTHRYTLQKPGQDSPVLSLDSARSSLCPTCLVEVSIV